MTDNQLIINQFPLKLREYVEQLNDPLCETQVLMTLFEDKNISGVFLSCVEELKKLFIFEKDKKKKIKISINIKLFLKQTP